MISSLLRRWQAATLVGFLLAILAGPLGAGEVERSASLRLEAQAGTWTGARLRGLPAAGSLALRVTSDGQVSVLLLDPRDYEQFPEVHQPLFRGSTPDRLGVEVSLREGGDYYLIIDNRESGEPRAVTVELTATAPEPSTAPDIHAQLDHIRAQLERAFIVEMPRLQAARCGQAELIRQGDRITICAEFGQLLLERLGERSTAQAALLFALMRELAGALLAQWDHPADGDGLAGDQLATVLMVMFNQEPAARRQAAAFAAPSEQAPAGGGRLLDRERAQAILDWLDGPELAQAWQEVLVPHMESGLLRRLQAEPPVWALPELAAEELARRG